HDMYNLEVFHIAREQSVLVVDITTPFLLNQDYTRYLCADGIHPNEEGHSLIAHRVIDYWQHHLPL
ncbi:MAG TPA: G-D-S-L family lipolytic protein, partial [Bacteroidales bacterium]|nr:G-D-S-L family lipolytic protein [Bacteroidales bacterium]